MTQEQTAERPKRGTREKAQRPLVGREPLADPEQVAAYLGGEVTTRTLDTWRYRETGPRFIKVGQLVRYRWSDVDAWLDSNTVDHQAAA